MSCLFKWLPFISAWGIMPSVLCAKLDPLSILLRYPLQPFRSVSIHMAIGVANESPFLASEFSRLCLPVLLGSFRGVIFNDTADRTLKITSFYAHDQQTHIKYNSWTVLTNTDPTIRLGKAISLPE